MANRKSILVKKFSYREIGEARNEANQILAQLALNLGAVYSSKKLLEYQIEYNSLGGTDSTRSAIRARLVFRAAVF